MCFYKKCHFYWLLSSLNSEEVDETWAQKMTKTSQCHESSQSQQSHVDHPFSNLEYFTNLNPENWQIISSLYLNHHVDPCRVRSGEINSHLIWHGSTRLLLCALLSYYWRPPGSFKIYDRIRPFDTRNLPVFHSRSSKAITGKKKNKDTRSSCHQLLGLIRSVPFCFIYKFPRVVFRCFCSSKRHDADPISVSSEKYMHHLNKIEVISSTPILKI